MFSNKTTLVMTDYCVCVFILTSSSSCAHFVPILWLVVATSLVELAERNWAWSVRVYSYLVPTSNVMTIAGHVLWHLS